MLEKNRDTLFRDLHEMIAASAKPFVAQLLGPLPGKATQKRPVTAGFQFRQQMGELVKVLGKCEPHYIRCLKPNQTLKAGDWDNEFMFRQLSYSGTLEVTEIRKAGLNVRRPRVSRVAHLCASEAVRLERQPAIRTFTLR